MKDCTNCDHSFYDYVFGVNRCSYYGHIIHDIDKYIDCHGHQERKNEEENA